MRTVSEYEIKLSCQQVVSEMAKRHINVCDGNYYALSITDAQEIDKTLILAG